MVKIYKKSSETSSATIYFAEDNINDKLILIPTNYDHPKKPIFFLRREKTYLSGLFSTKTKEIFSGDIKNPTTGMRKLFTATFIDNGDSLRLDGFSEEVTNA